MDLTARGSVNRLTNHKPGLAVVPGRISQEDSRKLNALKAAAEDAALEQREIMAKAQLAQIALDTHILKLRRVYGLTLGDAIDDEGKVSRGPHVGG